MFFLWFGCNLPSLHFDMNIEVAMLGDVWLTMRFKHFIIGARFTQNTSLNPDHFCSIYLLTRSRASAHHFVIFYANLLNNLRLARLQQDGCV